VCVVGGSAFPRDRALPVAAPTGRRAERSGSPAARLDPNEPISAIDGHVKMLLQEQPFKKTADG
jgi:hypothetical protein